MNIYSSLPPGSLDRILVISTLIFGIILLFRGIGINVFSVLNRLVPSFIYLVLFLSILMVIFLTIQKLRKSVNEVIFCVSLSKFMPENKQIIATQLLERLLRRASLNNIEVNLKSHNSYFVVKLRGNSAIVNDVMKMLKKIAFGLVIKNC